MGTLAGLVLVWVGVQGYLSIVVRRTPEVRASSGDCCEFEDITMAEESPQGEQALCEAGDLRSGAVYYNKWDRYRP